MLYIHIQRYYKGLEDEVVYNRKRFDVISFVSCMGNVQCTLLDTVIRWIIAESLLTFVTRVDAPCELPTKALRLGLLWQYQGKLKRTTDHGTLAEMLISTPVL